MLPVAETTQRNRARAYAAEYKRRGLLVPKPCEQVAAGGCLGRIEMHHDDYSKPLVVRWLCRRHHRLTTAAQRDPYGTGVGVNRSPSPPRLTRTAPLCAECGDERDRPGQRYCRRCHATYMREWRRLRKHAQPFRRALRRLKARGEVLRLARER